MKIAIIVGTFPPKWIAGTEMATHSIARHLAQRRHRIHVVTSRDKGLSREGVEHGFLVHRIDFPRVRLVGMIIFWLKVVVKLRKLRPDIIHSQSAGMGVGGFLAKRLLGKPYVVWGQGSDIYILSPLKRCIARLVLKNADTVIALTQHMKGQILTLCSTEVITIPNGVDVERYASLPEKAGLRRRMDLQEARPVVLFVGTLRRVKGVEYLVEAMSIVAGRRGGVSLLLVGDGDERQTLERLANHLDLGDTVTFVGQVPNDTVRDYMAAADIFVLPSLSEGFPLVIAEAMMAGLPIVASRVGGLPDIVGEGENGFLVDPGEPQQMSDRILTLLADHDLRLKMGAANRLKARSYSWPNVVEQLEEVYRSIIGGEQRRS